MDLVSHFSKNCMMEPVSLFSKNYMTELVFLSSRSYMMVLFSILFHLHCSISTRLSHFLPLVTLEDKGKFLRHLTNLIVMRLHCFLSRHSLKDLCNLNNLGKGF